MSEDERRRGRVRRIIESAYDAESDAMREMEERGELRHLHGQKLDLDDDPDWLVTRTLKHQGFTHPLLERAKELDSPREAAEQIVARLGRRYRWLSRPEARCSVAEAQEFNRYRARTFVEYREALDGLNRAITDYNLGVPAALHQRIVPIDRTMERVSNDIPPLSASVPAESPRRARLFPWRRNR